MEGRGDGGGVMYKVLILLGDLVNRRSRVLEALLCLIRVGWSMSWVRKWSARQVMRWSSGHDLSAGDLVEPKLLIQAVVVKVTDDEGLLASFEGGFVQADVFADFNVVLYIDGDATIEVGFVEVVVKGEIWDCEQIDWVRDVVVFREGFSDAYKNRFGCGY
ncbi:hypothetical protein CAPTEDRAFT_201333 [Capitella teleta]|uniref:Uncharacterized protein n=1 Tax=Capitella teleta TaxID=283909 RepID=R7UCM1_CAPTE|nr:hypothetical protein CAPTEDRAFT_201333 [Capitella teleta]|eukprot:ELU03744.1 hypothetical protein CAPTEDRAFT_201333 [Capitella teleta]